jgi:hypothetical protein
MHQLKKTNQTHGGAALRRFRSLTFACTLVLFAGLARAQQIDFLVGGSTLLAPKSYNASLAYPPPAQKGGTYASFSAEYIRKDHFGLNAELTFRYHEGLYNGYQRYRPALYDVNAVFAPRLGIKTRGDFMAGVGGESLIFHNRFANCTFSNCLTYVNSNHFLLHAGGGIRYYFWRQFFVRPEAHYYRVINNFQFNSDNVVRAGASVGYTFSRE